MDVPSAATFRTCDDEFAAGRTLIRFPPVSISSGALRSCRRINAVIAMGSVYISNVKEKRKKLSSDHLKTSQRKSRFSKEKNCLRSNSTIFSSKTSKQEQHHLIFHAAFP